MRRRRSRKSLRARAWQHGNRRETTTYDLAHRPGPISSRLAVMNREAGAWLAGYDAAFRDIRKDLRKLGLDVPQ